MSHVYFIQRGDNGPIKIGRSENVPRRLSELQTGCAEKLRLLRKVQENEHQTESIYHSICQAYRLEGEWFKPEGLVLECVLSETIEVCSFVKARKETKLPQHLEDHLAECEKNDRKGKEARAYFQRLLECLPDSLRAISTISKCVSCECPMPAPKESPSVCWLHGEFEGFYIDEQTRAKLLEVQT